jgi:DNA-binding transcriptional ArsR family regulator
MKVAAPSLVPILRSDTQGKVLAIVFENLDTERTLTSLATQVSTSFPTVQREIRRAEEAGIVTTRRVGNTRMVRADPSHPLFAALRQIILATFGAPAIVARELAAVDADAIILFGSWAARYTGERGHAPHDLDVLVLGQPDRDAVDDAAARIEAQVQLPVQITVRSLDEWRRLDDPFLSEVRRRPIVVVTAADSDLAIELHSLADQARR